MHGVMHSATFRITAVILTAHLQVLWIRHGARDFVTRSRLSTTLSPDNFVF
jgi:hypothetical protein